MRKIIALGLAGALATASLGVTAESANASPLGAFVVGAVVGGAVVAYVDRYHPFANLRSYGSAPGYPPAYVSSDDHTGWCQSHYRSYNQGTDTFTGYDGVAHACVSPH